MTGILSTLAKWAVLSVAGFFVVWYLIIRNKKIAALEQDVAAAQRAAKTRKDIDNADLGIGASDAERIERLRDFARR